MEQEIKKQLLYLNNLIAKEQAAYNEAMKMANQATVRIAAYGIGVDSLNELSRYMGKQGETSVSRE